MQVYAQHVLIAAIKYLDGTPNGYEGCTTADDRKRAIYLMLNKLPSATRKQLWKERTHFWNIGMRVKLI